jgi:Ca2+-binding RTX toxin-like protein
MLGRALAFAAVLVLAAGAPSAEAATLTGKVRPGNEETDGTPFGPVRYKAAPGEVNRLTVREVRGRIVYRDPGAVIRTRGNCRSLSPHVARCPYSESQARVNLGNGADAARLRVDFAPTVIGGRGPDRIVGGTGFDTLKGKGGRDTIWGGGGGDEIYGGGGSDRMLGTAGDDTLYDDRPDGPTSGDLFDGGAGKDTVDYSKRTRGLDLDLARRPVNNSAEGDRIVRVENANGGAGPDRIAGTARRDELEGNGGDDRLIGRGGPDYLQGRAGDDTILGGGGGDLVLGDAGEDSLRSGAGNDSVDSTDRFTGDRSLDRQADAVRCGAGDRDAMDGGPRDTITGCELTFPWEGVLAMRVQPEVAGDQATFTTRCDPDTGADACGGTVSLKSPQGVNYGSGPFSVPNTEKAATFSVTLTPEGQAALAAGGVVVVALRPDEDSVYGVVTRGYRTFMKG